MAGNDLIGAKQDPSGNIVGIQITAGDSFHPVSFGPVFQMSDGTYWRFVASYVNGVDSTDGVQPTFQQVTLS